MGLLHKTHSDYIKCVLKAELQLDGARKDCPGQGWMEHADERPMLLHEEQQA
ncbi:unnamed protein product [Schistosoma curassoni]|uniref:Transposase n=1 Tax=Schistosoma curassoni TaxID=6186 RepID=A0A183K0K6_9TREM|nr:unnamed protein product [Schistosoma curassoni]